MDGALLRLRGMPATESDGGMEAPESIERQRAIVSLVELRST